MRTKNKSNLVLFEVFLLIDFCKTLLTLLMVQRWPLLVLKHLLFGFLLTDYIIKRLTATQGYNQGTQKQQLISSDTIKQVIVTYLVFDSLFYNVFKL